MALLRLIVLLFLYRLDVFDSELLLDSPLLGLLAQLDAEILPCLISFGLLLFLLLSIEPSLLLGLVLHSPLLVDGGAACELVPHLAGAFHEVFVLDLFQPSVAEVAQRTLLALLLSFAIRCSFFFHQLQHSRHFDRVLT